MKKIINDSPSRGPVSAPLAGGLVQFGQVVEVSDEDAALLTAGSHFREATKQELLDAEKAAAKAAAAAKEK